MSEPKNNIDFVHLTNTQKDTILRLEKEIQELRNGQQGACYACEPVGELNKELEKEIKELEEKVKRENKSHNYHCKESQRKNDVIHDLEEEIKSLEWQYEELMKRRKEVRELKEKLENAKSILIRYRSDYSVQEFLKELEGNNE